MNTLFSNYDIGKKVNLEMDLLGKCMLIENIYHQKFPNRENIESCKGGQSRPEKYFWA